MSPRACCAIACILGLVANAAAAQDIHPTPTPRLYVTHNHGLRLEVPKGLAYCRLPEGWVGTDHGRSLFIGPARDCDDRDHPAIAIVYGFNQSGIEGVDGETRVLRSDREFRARWCAGQAMARSDMSLLQRTAALCLEQGSRHVVLTAYALYDIVGGRSRTPDGPDHELSVVLSTTPHRLGNDLRLFRRVLAGLMICTPEWVRGRHVPPACPRNSFWW